MKHNKRSFKEFITKEECRKEANSKLEGLQISSETTDSYVNYLYKKYKQNYESTSLPDSVKENRNEFYKRLKEQKKRDKLSKNMFIIEKIICTRTFIEKGKKIKYSKVKWLGYDKIGWVVTNNIKNI